jgi:CubicO group peptidase (beta-lactamase class C family)
VRIIGLVLAVLGANAAAAQAQSAETRDMDELVASYAAADQFMGSVFVSEGNKVLLNKAYGYANLEWKVANTPQTRIRICSITKQFTAVATLLLEQRGRLKTSDPVKKYVPGVPSSWDSITIHHLLTHTSGIADPQNLADFDPYALAKPADSLLKATPEGIKLMPLLFKAGERFEYSNSNYSLLGYIIEKVSGTPYETFVADNLFKPLGMSESGFDSWQTIIPNRAYGYGLQPDGLRNAHFIDMSNTRATGNIYSTAADMDRWQQGLHAGRVLNRAMLKKLTKPDKDGSAYGMFVQQPSRGTVYLHAGGMDGFDTIIGYWPQRKISVVVLANRNAPAGPIAAGLSALAHGEAAPLFRPDTVAHQESP